MDCNVALSDSIWPIIFNLQWGTHSASKTERSLVVVQTGFRSASKAWSFCSLLCDVLFLCCHIFLWGKPHNIPQLYFCFYHFALEILEYFESIKSLPIILNHLRSLTVLHQEPVMPFLSQACFQAETLLKKIQKQFEIFRIQDACPLLYMK